MRNVASHPLPHAREAELAVIGTVFSSPSSAFLIGEQLNPNYFFESNHKIIVEAISDLISENVPPDISLVHSRLKARGLHLKIGDLEGLRRFLDYAGRSELLPFLFKEIKKLWELRTVVETCSDIVSRAQSLSGQEASSFVEQVEQTFRKLSESRVETGLKISTDIVQETILKLEEAVSI